MVSTVSDIGAMAALSSTLDIGIVHPATAAAHRKATKVARICLEPAHHALLDSAADYVRNQRSPNRAAAASTLDPHDSQSRAHHKGEPEPRLLLTSSRSYTVLPRCELIKLWLPGHRRT